jgi:hypothetical protein
MLHHLIGDANQSLRATSIAELRRPKMRTTEIRKRGVHAFTSSDKST